MRDSLAADPVSILSQVMGKAGTAVAVLALVTLTRRRCMRFLTVCVHWQVIGIVAATGLVDGVRVQSFLAIVMSRKCNQPYQT